MSMARCPHCSAQIPQANLDLHQFRCPARVRRGGGTDLLGRDRQSVRSDTHSLRSQHRAHAAGPQQHVERPGRSFSSRTLPTLPVSIDVTAGAVADGETWTCPTCTLVNARHTNQCEACGESRLPAGNRARMISALANESLQMEGMQGLLMRRDGSARHSIGPYPARHIRMIGTMPGLGAMPGMGMQIESTMPGMGIVFEGRDDFIQRVLQHSMEEEPRMQPATEGAVQSLPTRALTEVDVASAAEEHQTCCICMTDFGAGDEQKTLPCFHRFHCACIDEWLQRNGNCPICQCRVDAAPVNE